MKQKEIIEVIKDLRDCPEHSTSKWHVDICANKLIEKLETKQLILSGVMHWVAIEDKLPPIEVDVLVWDEFNVYICNRLDEDGVVWDESTQILDGVTHWMHLPEPPCA
jgi:hypothetical protein